MVASGSRKSQVESRKSQVASRKSHVESTRKPPGPLELDRLIHERLRLGIVSALAANEALTFNELKQALDTTDGNLSVHARKLEDAEYILCTKTFQGRVPRTEYRLTAAGRRALEKYVTHMESILKAVRP